MKRIVDNLKLRPDELLRVTLRERNVETDTAILLERGLNQVSRIRYGFPRPTATARGLPPSRMVNKLKLFIETE